MLNRSKHGPGSVVWKISGEAAINLGGARAVLMQLAHPLVCAGVSAHSSYMTDPLGRAERTFMLGQMITFGSHSKVRQAARTINHLHMPVHGTLTHSVGGFPAGTQYNARDPKLLLWVHATLIDSILLVYPLLIGPLSASEEEEYYAESKEVAQLLGLSPSQMPEKVKDLRQYVHDTVYSDQMAATPEARQLAHKVLFPPIPSIFRPILHL